MSRKRCIVHRYEEANRERGIEGRDSWVADN